MLVRGSLVSLVISWIRMFRIRCRNWVIFCCRMLVNCRWLNSVLLSRCVWRLYVRCYSSRWIRCWLSRVSWLRLILISCISLVCLMIVICFCICWLRCVRCCSVCWMILVCCCDVSLSLNIGSVMVVC